MINLLNIKTNYHKGKEAEKLASKFLVKKGWTILFHNYKNKYGEIDLLATNKDVLVAFEVKYRKDESQLPYSISEKQKKRVIRAMKHFLQMYKKYYNYNIRIDVIFINSKKNITHIENSWSE